MKILRGGMCRGQHHQNRIVAAARHVAPAQLFILKVRQGLPIVSADIADGKVARKLQRNDALTRAQRLQVQRCLARERKILSDGGIHSIIQRRETLRRNFRRILGGEMRPDVVHRYSIVHADLPDEHLLVAALIHVTSNGPKESPSRSV